MDDPAERLARPSAPPYPGEGPHGMWHFSEDPTIQVFDPHVPRTNPSARPAVWAVDTRHAPLFWFPRECPRACAWASNATRAEDRAHFFGHSSARVRRIHVIESAWLARMRNCCLYAYALPLDTFVPHAEIGGYWLSPHRVEPLQRLEVGDLLDRHVEAEIELRMTDSVWPWWDDVTRSTLEFSACRLGNAAPRLSLREAAPADACPRT